MAWFRYFCPEHGEFKLSLPKREKMAACPECGQESKAIIKAGSVRVVEKVDRGTQARAAEHLKDIEEIMHERERKHSPVPEE